MGAISDMIGLPTTPTCGANLGLDPVRGNYCLWQASETQDWTAHTARLKTLKYTDFSNPKFTENAFTAVQDQLAVEWPQLSKVHAMMQGKRDLYRDAVYDTSTNANSVALVITNEIQGSGRVMSKGAKVLGGVWSVVSKIYAFARPLAPIILADPANPSPEEPTESNVPDLVDSAMALIGEMVGLAGANDDGSNGVATQLQTDATTYASDLNAQTGRVIANLATVENILVSDPVKLNLAAANSELNWDASNTDTEQQREDMTTGQTRDLWNLMLPSVYEMWRWPGIPAGFQPTDIVCKATGGPSAVHPIYAGQSPKAVFQPPTAYDANGNVTHLRTLLLTYNRNNDVSKDVDRLMPPALADALLAGTGYAPAELVSQLPVDWRVYPDGMEVTGDQADAGFCSLKTANGKTALFEVTNY